MKLPQSTKRNLLVILCIFLLGITAILGTMVYYAANGGWPAKQEPYPSTYTPGKPYFSGNISYMYWTYGRYNEVYTSNNITGTAERDAKTGWAIGSNVMKSWQEYQDAIQKIENQISMDYAVTGYDHDWAVVRYKAIVGGNTRQEPFFNAQDVGEALFDQYNLVLLDVQRSAVNLDAILLGTCERDGKLYVGLGLDFYSGSADSENGRLYWFAIPKAYTEINLRYYHTYAYTKKGDKYQAILPEDDPWPEEAA